MTVSRAGRATRSVLRVSAASGSEPAGAEALGAVVRDAPGGARLTFAADKGFHAELKRRVLAYFEESGRSPRDNPRMYLKTAALMAWFGLSYALLVFAATTWWQGALLSVSLALSVAGIGFGVQHDANHGAYSNNGAINRCMGMTLDMLGASSHIWHWKHNIFHHSYTNMSGADDDIDFLPFARLSPAQPRYPMHRVQQFYLWLLYGFLLPKWHFIDDFKSVIRRRIASNRFPRPSRGRLAELLGGKALFFAWAFVIPLLFHPWWAVLLCYAATSLLVGFTLAVVFQLAHCVEEAAFPERPRDAERMADGWAVHQVRTTVDFARDNRLLTWYLGGLNFQIEHHLFPKICHVHYPRIARIVEELCAESGVPYTAHETFRGALASHWRFLRRMGLPLVAEPAAPLRLSA